MAKTDLHIKYRPIDFELVLGQDAVIQSLIGFEKTKKWPHAFLFTGGSGCGKTTLSRIIANKIGAHPSSIVEVDAATYNGVDNIRAITADLDYTGFGDNPVKFIIVDECHMLSKGAWNALLKNLEEPPEHVYFALCTTEVDKVPKTIQTRCHQYNLRSVGLNELIDLVFYVAEEEKLNIPEKGLALIAQEALGSPRQALVLLGKARFCTTLEEVKAILESADEQSEIIDLCRALMGRTKLTWKRAIGLLAKLENVAPESIRLTIVNYGAKALLNTPAENDAVKLLAVLDAFSKPCNPSEKMAPILLAIGSLLFSDDGE